MNAMTEVRHAIPALAMQEAELISVLQTSLYPGASLPSIKMVVSYCKAAGLDPLQKPVHIVPMWDGKAKQMRDVVMPGVNLYRTQAARSGALAGVSEPEFGPDVTENIGGVSITFPQWCRVIVKRRLASGEIADFAAIERWKENYAVKGGQEKSIAPNAMWQRRPYGQIAKCAQAQALRVAFPELAGGYTADEMEGKTIEGTVVEGEIFDPAELHGWIDSAKSAATTAQLESVWKAGVKAISAYKDRPAYDAFKDAVTARGAALKAAAEQVDPPEPGSEG
jgi:phage recombination protein Bet